MTTTPSLYPPPVSLAVKPRIIGLTGGVGMGKTTISNYLAQQHGIPVLDADLYAREAVAPGEILDAIAARYGSTILHNGELDRRRLSEIVFNSASELHWLEQQIHPFVRDRITADLKALAEKAPVILVVVPLLFEARMTDLVTEIWVVTASQNQQQDRLIERDRLTPDQVRSRIASQLAIEKKVAQAQVVLDNSGSPEALFQQVEQALLNR
jgi:dephospho-CoA kinase